jgi:hypothetical protein
LCLFTDLLKLLIKNIILQIQNIFNRFIVTLTKTMEAIKSLILITFFLPSIFAQAGGGGGGGGGSFIHSGSSNSYGNGSMSKPEKIIFFTICFGCPLLALAIYIIYKICKGRKKLEELETYRAECFASRYKKALQIQGKLPSNQLKKINLNIEFWGKSSGEFIDTSFDAILKYNEKILHVAGTGEDPNGKYEISGYGSISIDNQFHLYLNKRYTSGQGFLSQQPENRWTLEYELIFEKFSENSPLLHGKWYYRDKGPSWTGSIRENINTIEDSQGPLKNTKIFQKLEKYMLHNTVETSFESVETEGSVSQIRDSSDASISLEDIV